MTYITGGNDCWNKICLTLPLKVLSDNKVLNKLLIGYANICSSVHDHRQKI